ncbi:hypothetical protein HYDPIDRAFT_104387 [Hydnomerulius pinastri MD-312]|nr:hypothetical protein HYDPIDRAFT_104387 [Hydnomerulius pinastri MD-312]
MQQPQGFTDLHYILQSPLICTFFACLLYGVISTQSFAYMLRFPKDSWVIKWTVLLIFVLEGVHTALLMNVLNYYIIQEGGDEVALAYIYKGVGICYIFGYISTYLVNVFYVWRMWIISQRSLFSIIIAVLATARVAVEIAFCTLSMFKNEWDAFSENLRSTFLSTVILTAIVDCWIALSMTYYLHHGRTSISATDSVINRCVRYTVGTGVLTFIFTITILVTLFTGPSITFLCLVPVQTKLYSNSLLVSLNSRNPKHRLRRQSAPVLPLAPPTPSESNFSRVDLIPPMTPRWNWKTGDEPSTPYSPGPNDI